MSAFMEDVARASLPVAIALLAFAAAARAVLWAQFDDAQTQRIARQYAEPLSTWCLIAAGTHLFALSAAGNAGAGSLVVAVGLGAAAALLRATSATTQSSKAAPAEQPTAPPAPAPAPTAEPRPVPTGRLWADPLDEQPTRQGGLWSR
jgi:peptidoglycan/LPS O-acetylase OafA/YrhL